MRPLVIQLVPPRGAAVRAEYRQELAVATSLLRRQGVEVALVALDGYRPGRLAEAVRRHDPTHVVMEVPPARPAAARHVIVDLGERFALPVVLVGAFATSQPEQAISIPGAFAVVVGEFDLVLSQLLTPAGWPSGGAFPRTDVPGVWVNAPGGLVRNEPAPLCTDLDALPFGDREVFGYQRIVDATGQAVFWAGRGCPRWCAFCLNDWYLDLYEGQAFVRRRSLGNLLEEIDQVTSRYRRVREAVFGDPGFTDDADWLEEFARQYPRRCGLPFRCHVHPGPRPERLADLLARAGCRTAEMEVASASRFVRQEVLSVPAGAEQVVECASALRGRGVRLCLSVFVGAPYDSEVAVGETLDLLAALKPEEIEVRVFYPVPGTRAAEVCRDNDWVSERGEESFFRQRSVLDMPAFPARRIEQIARHYAALLRHHRGRSLSALVERIRRMGKRPLRRRRRRAGASRRRAE